MLGDPRCTASQLMNREEGGATCLGETSHGGRHFVGTGLASAT